MEIAKRLTSIGRADSLPFATRTLLLAVSLFLFLTLNAVGATAQTGDDHGNTFDSATPISLGSSIAGRIDPGDDVDIFKLDLSSRVGATDVWIYTTGELNTVGWLYDANDDLQAYDYDLATGQDDNFHLRAILPSGVYYLEVRSEGVGIGDYTLQAEISTDTGSTTGTAATLSLDSPTTGTIVTSEDVDYFRFSLTEPLNLAIHGQSGNRDVIHGVVLDIAGTEVSVNVRPGFRIEDHFEPGTYFVRVSTPVDVSSHPVPYTIHAYEDTAYTDFIKDCGNATDSLNNPQISDPLYGCQWHLSNSDGEDINVEAVWATGINGGGINVVVIDDGMDHRHEDLIGNVDASLNHDYTGGGDIHQPLEHHGTNVAGIIAASANPIGVRGVAPQATIYGYNFLASETTDMQWADAMARHRDVTAVSNNSWGPRRGPGLGQAGSFWEAAVESGIRTGYNGKGTFYVFSGGNGHLVGDNSNLSEPTNFYGVTAVCAVSDTDRRSAYSEMGANLWVCAPSGDRGEERRSIVTTENSDRYMDDFSGTSASTPIVSGVAALMRQANPDLTWRDLKLILAASARKNDPTNTGWEDGAQKYGSESVSDLYHFNHEYGFGMVDAGAAVAMAKEWTDNLLPLQSETVESSDPSVRIPDAPAIGQPTTVTQTLTMDTGIEFIEFVEVNLAFQHDSFRDLEIELESPSGAVSQLTVPFDTYDDDDPEIDFVPLRGSFRFGSARHLGEDPNGVWKLRVTDSISLRGGILESWGVTVYGHGPTPGAPTLGSVTSRAGSLTIAWTAPNPTDGATVTSYDLRYIQSAVGDMADANWIVVEDVWTASTGGSLEYTITPLVGGSEYQVQVRADSERTSGTWSNAVTGTPNRITTNACASGSAVSNPSGNTGLVSDCNALLAARDALAGSATLNWSASTPISVWYGVTVDGTPLRVTELDLYDSQLTGAIPSELRSLDRLQVLSLGGNELTGPIPAWLGEMDNLLTLTLWGNRLAGGIPSELRRLHNLQVLSISGKHLTGVIPAWLGELDSLLWLYVYDSQLSGPIPSSLGNLNNLQRLVLRNNELTGPVPSWLGNLSSLELLSLSSNQLTGPIPTQLGRLSRLQELYLHRNQLTEPIPTGIGALPKLEVLSLGGNDLSGTVPTQLGNLSNLREMYLWGNDLSGTVPVQLGSLSNLEVLSLSSNQLNGPIPAQLGNVNGLVELSLYNNQLSGAIPTQLGNLDTLVLLSLSLNQLSGPVPDSLGSLDNLEYLAISRNQLTGQVPMQLGSLSSLTELYLWGNELTGPVPPSLSNLSNLEALHLQSNKLTGTIPSDLVRLTKLEVLYLSRNQFNGCIPAGLRIVAESDLYDVGLPFCDVLLSGLTTTPGSLNPAFDPYRSYYYGTVASGTQVTVNPTNAHGAAFRYLDEINVELADADDSLAGHQVVLGDGITTIRIVVVSQDRRVANTYTIQFSRTPLASGTCITGEAVMDPVSNPGLVSDCNNLLSARDKLTGDATLNWSADISIMDWDGVTVGGRLQRVIELNLGNRQLTGSIPAELGSLNSLEQLTLSLNRLSGPIPAELGRLSKVHDLNLTSNQLTGHIPTQLGSLVNLEDLQLGGNQLTGPIPSELGSLANLQELSLWGNDLTGLIPSQLGNLSDLVKLSLSDNQLTGAIPAELGGLSSLEFLDISENQLSGLIPPELGNISDLRNLELSGNTLTGPVPSRLGSLSKLDYLDLTDNQLTGPIPHELGDLSSMTSLYLSKNQLTSSIPTELGNLHNLEALVISQNGLTGPIPTELGNLSNLVFLSLWGNQLTGSIPVSLGSLVNLGKLYLSQNQLTGCIPAALQDIVDNDLDQLGLPFCSLPTVTPSITSPSVLVRINSPVPVTATFSEPVYRFTVEDITVTSGSAGNFVGSDGDSVYTFDVTPNAIGDVTVDIADGVAVDADEIGNTAAVQLSLGIPYDDDHDGSISRAEVITAIADYLFSGTLTRNQVIAIIALYLFG